MAANGGRRLFTKHEKALVHQELQHSAGKETPDFPWHAARLRARHGEYFGIGTPRMPEGISRQQVRAIYMQGCPVEDGLCIAPGSGRPSSLPPHVRVLAENHLTDLAV